MGKPGLIKKLAGLRMFLAGCETYCIVPTAWIYMKSLDQTEFFLALVLSAYNFGAVIAGPLFGLITDRLGNPRFIFIFSCVIKVLAYVMYSVNLSGYFPLFGRLISGLSDMGIAVLLGQIALQTDQESRGGHFVLLESLYCLGSSFGPVIGIFFTFRINIFGWAINEGNSPGIVLTIIWFLFLMFSLLLPKNIWTETGARGMEMNSMSSEDGDEKPLRNKHDREAKLAKDRRKQKLGAILNDSRILCLLFLIFCNEAFSNTSTFYVPVLALDHFHLQLIHIKLLFLNCTLFTLTVFICFYLASKYIDERKLLVIALFMQIIAISFLSFLAFYWDQITTVQYYILLAYICFGMPYFAYPFGNSLLSKITDPGNATFIQGLSLGCMNSAIVISRILISFVFTKMSLICYSFGMVIVWLAGVIWFATVYNRMVPDV